MIYAIQMGETGPIKIGYTRTHDVRQRVESLQTGNPYKLIVRAIKHGERKQEKAIHRRLADWRLEGEWFEPSPMLWALMDALPRAVLPNEDGVVYPTELIDGVLYPVLRRYSRKDATEKCWFCFQRHWHGDQDGLLLAHCELGKGPPQGGYVVRTTEHVCATAFQ